MRSSSPASRVNRDCEHGMMSKSYRILLAEDNPADVYLIEEALREHKLTFEMILAEDGEEALSMLSNPETRPDIVLLDLNMPKRSGGEVLGRLQRDLEGIPVVVLTSSDSPVDREEAMRLGATTFIRKPTGLDEFLEIGATIKQLVGAQ
jgi:CheY-like chemotaxis protein